MFLLIFLIIIITSIISLIILYNKKNEKYNNIKYNGICAFDLDKTLTCGIHQGRKAIKECKNMNYKIAIITARPTPWYNDINLEELGLKEEDFIDDFYYGDNYTCSFTNIECLQNEIAKKKLNSLKHLSKKYNITNNNIILFDDLYENINLAKNEGFSTIHANHDICGLPMNVDKLINKNKDFHDEIN